MAELGDPFRDFVAELGDGQKWALIRAQGWDEFVERLADKIVDLPPTRRFALLLMLMTMAEGRLTPEQLERNLAGRDMEDDDEIVALTEWLRKFRPEPGDTLDH
jgi:DNA-binding response OmpR family regulator